MGVDRLHRILLGVVALIVAATAFGLVALWPREPIPTRDEGAPAEPVIGTVVGIAPYQGEPDPVTGSDGSAAVLDVRLEDGPVAGEVVEVDTSLDELGSVSEGTRLRLSSYELEGEDVWFVVDRVRGPALWILLGVFVLAVVGIGRWQGVRALLGLALSLLVVGRFVVPAILAGRSPFLVALVGATAVLLVSMYLAHGPDPRTTTAVVGTALALGVTVGLGALFVDAAALTGLASEDAVFARNVVGGLDLQGLVLAGLTIAALGVLDDVTITQASTVFALRSADPGAGTRQLVARALVVGRDHIASTVNTLFLAYVGASLALLVLFSVSGLPLSEVVESELVATEIVKTLVGSLGIVAAVPTTTVLAAVVAVRTRGPLPTDGHGHSPRRRRSAQVSPPE